MHLWGGSPPSVSLELWKFLHGGGLRYTQTHIHTIWRVHRCLICRSAQKNTKQVLPPTHFHCPKLSQHDLLIWQKLTHHEGLWSECSFQPPQESAVQSSAEKRWLEEERWDENAVLKTETECRERCKERGRKKRMKERKTNNREGKYARQKDAMQETKDDWKVQVSSIEVLLRALGYKYLKTIIPVNSTEITELHNSILWMNSETVRTGIRWKYEQNAFGGACLLVLWWV